MINSHYRKIPSRIVPKTLVAKTYKQSRLNFWSDRIPLLIAEDQVGWERLRDMLRMKELGLPVSHIEKHLGVANIVSRGLLKRPLGRSPAERFLAEGAVDLERLGTMRLDHERFPPPLQDEKYWRARALRAERRVRELETGTNRVYEKDHQSGIRAMDATNAAAWSSYKT